MKLEIRADQKNLQKTKDTLSKFNDRVFSKDYVEFLYEAGWRLEKKLPSNSNNYSDLLEDTEWKTNHSDYRCSKHYRRDLDAIS